MTTKRFFSIILTLCIVASMFSGVFGLNAFAENFDSPSYLKKRLNSAK